MRRNSLKGVGVVIAVLLAGCSTVNDIRQNPPLLSIGSVKGAETVAECIQDGWQNTSLIGGTVGGQLQKLGSRYAVVAPNSETPWHVADVSPNGAGSTVSYRFYRTWQSPPDRVTDVVKRCAR
ncbi:hypothetical protein PchlO6_2168 [Pseudomonas chlororaphis O6]|uniref:Lipoprotein n=1 Tax=Pseudomonas chlororaphis O6 TaxID=1037915 RepID=A0AB33WLD8_9PSED|nr:hypothetical protein PchlO6_2168 [Pseudomonas chlororaphis O6]